MNNVIRRTNKIVPIYNLNDTSPITMKNQQKKQELHNQMQEDQLTDFTRKYRQIIQQEQVGNADFSRCLKTQSTPNINYNSYKNELNSRQFLDTSEQNLENQSPHSLEIYTPVKRTTKSIGVQRFASQPTLKSSTCISDQNSYDMKSPITQTSQMKLELSSIKRINQRYLLTENTDNTNEIRPDLLTQMQDTFYKKSKKTQNQQFLHKCFGFSQLRNQQRKLNSPIRTQKIVPLYLINTACLNEKKYDTNSISKSIYGLELDILKQINTETERIFQEEQPNNSNQGSSSLNKYLNIQKKQIENTSDNKRNVSAFNKKSEQLSKVLNYKFCDLQNKRSFLVHKEKDYTMNSSKNFAKHLQSLQDLSQSNRKHRKIRTLIDQVIKQSQEQDQDESQSKTFRSLLYKQDYIISKTPNDESAIRNRQSSVEECKQLHYFNQIRKDSIYEAITDNNTDYSNIDSKQSSDAFNQSKFNKANKKDSLYIQEQNQIDKQFEEKIKNCKLMAKTSFEKLEKLKQMSISQSKQIKILKDMLLGYPYILDIVLDKTKQNFNQQLNIKMLEDLILSEDSIQNKEINVTIENEFKLFILKMQDFLFNLQLQKFDVQKEKVINQCQNLQDRVKNFEKENKFNFAHQGKKILENLSFMKQSMLNKNHSFLDQLNKAKFRYGSLCLINDQNISMNRQIDNNIDKMVELRQRQINKMKDIFQNAKQKQ